MSAREVSPEVFPFEPHLEGQENAFEGLDKLRCIKDPVLRAQLWRLWWNLDERARHRTGQQTLDWSQQPRRECVDLTRRLKPA